eukprot:scaffold3089_cov136-Isochrysis_galbana.AAC.6
MQLLAYPCHCRPARLPSQHRRAGLRPSVQMRVELTQAAAPASAASRWRARRPVPARTATQP